MRRVLGGRALLAAALLAPALARAAGEELGGPLPVFAFAALRPLAAPPPPGSAFIAPESSLGAPAAVVALPPLLDNVSRTRATFRAGSVVVHVYGEKSRNKGDWFIGFAAEGAEPQFRNGHKMIHWTVLHRTVRFTAGGKSFSAYIQGDLSNRMQSRIVVSADDRSQPQSSWSVQEITDDGYESGAPVRLGGREFRLFYARDFDQDDDGAFAGYTGGRSIVLVAREQGRFTAFHWYESDVPRDGGVLAVSEKPAFADQQGAGPLLLGLRRTADDRLEIYDRSAAPVARK
jgi:hypothetical protein